MPTQQASAYWPNCASSELTRPRAAGRARSTGGSSVKLLIVAIRIASDQRAVQPRLRRRDRAEQIPARGTASRDSRAVPDAPIDAELQEAPAQQPRDQRVRAGAGSFTRIRRAGAAPASSSRALASTAPAGSASGTGCRRHRARRGGCRRSGRASTAARDGNNGRSGDSDRYSSGVSGPNSTIEAIGVSAANCPGPPSLAISRSAR